jgi:hypothetical protein
MFIKGFSLWFVSLFIIFNMVSMRYDTFGIKQLGFPKAYYYSSYLSAKTGNGVTHSLLINSLVFNLIICALLALIITFLMRNIKRKTN